MNVYDGIHAHRQMVGDGVRTGAFRDSILATVRPGDVVLDVGAGSGILSLFAAQAGAARVYALERAPRAAALARRLVSVNGFGDRIRIIEGDAEQAVLPEPVDVIVSEWLGVFGVDENMLGAVLGARDRWLRPGGTMIPGAVAAHLAPAAHPAAAPASAFGRPAYGLDLRALAPADHDGVVWLSGGIDEAALRAEPQRLWVTDPARMPAAQARRPFAAERSFAMRGGAHALVAWFSAAMPGAPCLTNRPGAAPTHWGHYLFPVANAAAATADDRLEVGFHCVPRAGGGSHQIWASRLNEGSLEVHDTRRAGRAVAGGVARVPRYAGVR